jgi:hypothetical protein
MTLDAKDSGAFWARRPIFFSSIFFVTQPGEPQSSIQSSARKLNVRTVSNYPPRISKNTTRIDYLRLLDTAVVHWRTNNGVNRENALDAVCWSWASHYWRINLQNG